MLKMMLSSKGALPAHQISVQRLKLAPNSSEAGGSQSCKTQMNEAARQYKTGSKGLVVTEISSYSCHLEKAYSKARSSANHT